MELRLLPWFRGQKCLKGGVLVSENRLSRAILPLSLRNFGLLQFFSLVFAWREPFGFSSNDERCVRLRFESMI